MVVVVASLQDGPQQSLLPGVHTQYSHDVTVSHTVPQLVRVIK